MAPSLARTTLDEMRRVGPHDAAHVPAIRAGISVGLPLIVLLAADRIEWSAFCAFGAFAAIYGRGLARRPRLRMQGQAAVALLIAVTSGTALSLVDSRAWWVVLGATLVTAATALAADALRWRPPGGLFTLFGFAVCAMTPDNSVTTVVIAAGLCAAASAFGIAVSVIGTAGSPTVPDRPSLRLQLREPRTRLLLLRFLVAPAVAGSIATAAGIGHPYWGMVAAVSVLTAPSVRDIASRGTLRAAGTVAGLGVTAVILALDPGPAAIVAVIIVAQVAAELFVMRNYAVAAAFITPLALLMGQLVHPVPTGELLAQRGLETLIGVAVGVTVAWVTGRQANRRSPQ